MVGPVVQQEVFDIIIRFRFDAFVMTADVEKMYRQIWIQQLQLIFWKDGAGSSKIFKLKTVTYGTSSASYLATKVIQQLAKDEGRKFPEAS